MLLAAGLGTRLRPLTDERPKPAVPLLGRPLAHYAIDRLLAAGVTELAANAHHLPEQVASVVRARVPDALVSVEPVLLGTGGGIRRALTQLAERSGRPLAPDEPLVVSNADVLFAPDLPRALAIHRASRAFATMIVRRDPRADAAGPIDLDAKGRVRRILRVPESSEPLERTMFTGLSILSGAAVLDLPQSGCVVRQGLRRWLDRGEIVQGVVEEAPFRDLGTPAEYLAAHVDLLDGSVPWQGITPAPAWVHPTAKVDGAVLRQTSVGEGASVLPGVTLERVVVWPGTVVRASERGVILHPSGRLAAS